MGRSKKNWDHLVDVYGNYGIDIKEGRKVPKYGEAIRQSGLKTKTEVPGVKGKWSKGSETAQKWMCLVKVKVNQKAR